MREGGGSSGGSGHSAAMYADRPMPHSDQLMHQSSADEDSFMRHSSSSTTASSGFYSDYPMAMSGESSPFIMSPWHQSSPHPANDPAFADAAAGLPFTGLISSLVREEGHIYSLAAIGDLLYTGSDSKNIRVWKNQKDFAGFKSSSGLVKAIVIAADRIFTGHQDGKIRVWRVSPKSAAVHKRIGSLPRLKDVIRSSLKPSNYVEVRRHRSALWIRHSDAISCLCLDEDQGLLYSSSWDKTFKVWRISDSRCLESVIAHDDAVNSVVTAFGGLVFTGSADGTVKVWRRELQVKSTKHSPVQTLLKQESAVTSLAVSPTAPILYCGSSDGIINFWEGEGQLSHGGVLRGHKMAVLCLAAAGSLLLSGSADKNICVWRREGTVHNCLSVLSGHSGPVKCLAIVTDTGGEEGGRGGAAASWIVYSGSLDKSVKVWRVSEQSPEALLRAPQTGAYGGRAE
ncbi:unnamed protein product [Musa acuminata subsp. malaccensis]|uniref:(wild Malaysian banana) hypothetical protein n=1 Tax=Musa acuminata subsp. malaccensis TaxID=214687 RepID=A0A804IM43_MUSAM|nr:PREDICTED: uncharacterized protein LOC103981590 [Musa acuminata subsp. malaccensis]CAG1841479.1 unnamed protein product [Musa acuminata subsp. malaccensis]